MDNQLTIQSHNDSQMVTINRSLPTEHEMMVFKTISKQASESNMYKNYGGEAGIMMTILAARELGIPPMLALNGGISNIQGKLEISARLMHGMMRRAGVKIIIKESTDAGCMLTGVRADTGDTATVSYSVADAQKAGLIKAGGGWIKNPKDMCFARAISRLARQIAPDIIGGCYIEGEIKATDAEIIFPSEILVDTDQENLENLLKMFDKDDSALVMQYIQVVMKHFSWSQSECILKFLEEKSIVEKFNAWKNKRSLT